MYVCSLKIIANNGRILFGGFFFEEPISARDHGGEKSCIIGAPQTSFLHVHFFLRNYHLPNNAAISRITMALLWNNRYMKLISNESYVASFCFVRHSFVLLLLRWKKISVIFRLKIKRVPFELFTDAIKLIFTSIFNIQ